jgi:hypothetical protein
MKTIFVSVASLYDEELVRTIADAFDKAAEPSRVFVGVAIADSKTRLYKQAKKLSKKHSNLTVSFAKITKTNQRSIYGVGRGRLRAASLYSNQDYFLQIDSHTMFLEGWDTTLIDLLNEAKTEIGSDKVILTTYAGKYYLDKEGNRVIAEDDNIPGTTKKLGFLYNTFWDRQARYDVVPSWVVINSENARSSSRKFIPSFKFSANFAFGDSSFAKNLGITEKEIFFEEELIQTMRLMSAGYSLVYPNIDNSVIKHLYGDYGTNDSFIYDYKRHNMATAFYNISFGEEKDEAIKNYFNFVFDSNNRNLVESYQRYAGIDLLTCRSHLHDSFPDSWKLDIIEDKS